MKVRVLINHTTVFADIEGVVGMGTYLTPGENGKLRGANSGEQIIGIALEGFCPTGCLYIWDEIICNALQD